MTTTLQKMRAELSAIAGKPGKAQAAAQRLLATLDDRVDESNHIRRLAGLSSFHPKIEHLAGCSVFRAMTAEEARAHCKAGGLK